MRSLVARTSKASGLQNLFQDNIQRLGQLLFKMEYLRAGIEGHT